ncbi:hypothetical protein CR969_03385 [Candidatus Saccharibacteria bacterium]|nr:MAG: hypothetical protein CR969_03385 [Candidatus Saccharibacteria bacterium]
MSQDKSIEQSIKELEVALAWFHGEDFSLDKASQKFKELQKLADSIEERLSAMKNEIKLIEKDFS